MINHDAIIQYIEQLSPEAPLAQAQTIQEISSIMQALIGFSDRFNAPRKFHLLKDETAQLKETIAQLKHLIGQMDHEQEEHRLNMDQLHQLRTEHEQLSHLEKQRTEIRELQEFLSGKGLSALQQELASWQQTHQGDIDGLNNSLHDLDTFFTGLQSDLLQETKHIWMHIQEKRRLIDTTLQESTAAIRTETAELAALTTQYSRDLDEAITSHTAVHSHLLSIKEKLTDIRDQHNKNIQVYQQHFEQNQAIYGALGKRHQLDNHLKALFDQVGEKLQQFDREIKVLVEQADKLTIY